MSYETYEIISKIVDVKMMQEKIKKGEATEEEIIKGFDDAVKAMTELHIENKNLRKKYDRDTQFILKEDNLEKFSVDMFRPDYSIKKTKGISGGRQDI